MPPGGNASSHPCKTTPTMKNTCFSAFVALGFATAACNGFTLDFVADVGANLPPDLVINVPGYGNVQFTPLAGSTLVVGTTYQTGGVPTPTLQFDSGEIVQVTFLALTPSSLAFDFLDVSPGESTFVNTTADPKVFTVQLSGSGDGAGLQQITFTAVPETSAATLGLLGSGLLMLRRRR